jgi:hypothetical protein
MKHFISMTNLVRVQVEPYVCLCWFLYEAAEREHRLNLQALSGTFLGFVQAWAPMAASGRARTDAAAPPGQRRAAAASAVARRADAAACRFAVAQRHQAPGDRA